MKVWKKSGNEIHVVLLFVTWWTPPSSLPEVQLEGGRLPRNLADQVTLFKPGWADFTPHTTASPFGFKKLSTSLQNSAKNCQNNCWASLLPDLAWFSGTLVLLPSDRAVTALPTYWNSLNVITLIDWESFNGVRLWLHQYSRNRRAEGTVECQGAGWGDIGTPNV